MKWININLITIGVVFALFAGNLNAEFINIGNATQTQINGSSKVISQTGSMNVLLGNRSSTYFMPMAEFSRTYFEDANLTIRYTSIQSQTPDVNLTNGTITYKSGVTTVQFYNINNKSIDAGGFEFAAIYNSKPFSNVLQFYIDSQNLDYYYQPPLNQVQEFNGLNCNATACYNGTILKKERSQDVVGSYAVYHSSKVGNKYGTGKVAHIYRPFVNDSKGNFAYANLSIDIATHNMTIVVPQSFLDNAVYPVFVDPTIGYTTAGASPSTGDSGGFNAFAYGLPNTTGTFTSISISIADATTSLKFKMAIYPNLAGTPPSSLANCSGQPLVTGSSTGELTVSQATKGWQTATITGTVTSGQYYWLTAAENSDSITTYFDTGAADYSDMYDSQVYANFPPATAPEIRYHGTSRYSYFANYTTAGTVTFGNNITSGTVAGSSVSHNITWNTTGSLSGYICSFYNGGNKTFTTLSANLVSSTMMKRAEGLTNYSTGILSPTQNIALAGQGWFNASAAYILGGTTSNETIALTARNGANQTGYYGYNPNIPTGSTILGFQTYLNASCAATTGTNPIQISLSNDSGTNYVGKRFTPVSDYGTAYTYSKNGSSSDLWGEIWNVSNANNVRVNVTGMASATGSFLRLDYMGLNITYQNYTAVVDGNTTTDNYSLTTFNPIGQITNISITINVTFYNNTKSSLAGTVNPDLWLEFYNGSSFLQIGNMSVNSVGNFTVYIPNNNSFYNNISYGNHIINFSIKGVYLDSNSSLEDFINYSGVFLNINTTNDFVNDSWTAFSGTSNVSQMVKTINATVGATIKWYCSANDTTNQWNTSSVYTYTTTSGGASVITFTVYTLGGSYNWTNSVTSAPYNTTDRYYFNATGCSGTACMYKQWVYPCSNADYSTNCQNGATRPAYRVLNTGSVPIALYMKLDNQMPSGILMCANSTGDGIGSPAIQNTVAACVVGSLNETSWFRVSSEIPASRYANVTVYANFSYAQGGISFVNNVINSTE